MANPQIEKGYTPVANELLEVICRTKFTATELKIILFIMRFTYGYSRKEYQLSLTFISKGIGISKRYVSSSIGELIKDNVVCVVRKYTDTESRIIRLNKDYEKWKNRIIAPWMKCSSTDEAEFHRTDEAEFHTTDEAQFYTTDEPEFTTTDEVQFHQEKQNIKQNIKQAPAPDLFSIFWSAYPRKVAKTAAKKSFDKLKVDEPLLKQILAALEIQKKSKQWSDINYIPHPTTYLNQRRYEDEEIEETEERISMTDDGIFRM